eukprot:TRINITY_DN48475_c0_g1_i1.p1 TRINITY_DN48475_c0_g1~~TRINITY_DN48475_c0_g1_i1.p1  ORF type:complete len:507 (-),score=139.25 TRINITY_DN48475_c0_g1_i1:65-1528(-)
MAAASARTPRVVPHAHSQDLAAEALKKVQAYSFARRTRSKDHFVDFDKLRSGRCTKGQFVRGLRAMGISLHDSETAALVDHYTEGADLLASPTQGLQNVRYDRFCEDIDGVFAAPMQGGPTDAFINAAVQQLLARLARLCRSSAVSLRSAFADGVVRTPLASPGRPTPRLMQSASADVKVPVSHFRRAFPFLKEVTPADLDLLVSRYGRDAGLVDVDALQKDIEQAVNREGDFARPGAESVEWSQQRMSPVEKIRAKVVEKRVRLCEFFQDFDALRRGVCTVGQLKTVLSILTIEKDIDRADFSNLLALYCRDDGMFSYADFCADVQRVFALPGLEKDPLQSSRMPDADTTAPARRNRQNLPVAMLQKALDLEERLRQQVQRRRLLMRPMFADMDKVRSGHVTRRQMERVLSFFGFELDESSIGILCAVYCDLGNRHEFNYMDFCDSVEPPDEAVKLAEQQLHVTDPDSPPKYFDAHGSIRPIALLA